MMTEVNKLFKKIVIIGNGKIVALDMSGLICNGYSKNRLFYKYSIVF